MITNEQEIQRIIIKHLKFRGAGIFYFHCPNGGFRRPIEAAVFKSLGVVAGIPDLIILKAGRMYALELKAQHGTLSKKQSAVLDEMRRCGAVTGVTYGLDAAIAWLENEGLLRGRALI